MRPKARGSLRKFHAALVIMGALLSDCLMASWILNPEVGGQAIVTNYSLGFPDCERETIDRRVSLGISPREQWSQFGIESAFVVEHQVKNESEVRPFHRVLNSAIKFGVGRHKLGLSLVYDDSEQVLWGCAASLATRLRREQRIREDLQVAGNRVRAFQKTFRYDYEKHGHSIGAMVADIREQGDYSRFQTDLLILYSWKLSRNFIFGLRSGVGDEGIREERYRNLRAAGNLVYKPFPRWTFFGELGNQRRGELQRITNWDTRVEHQYNPKIRLSVTSSKVVSQAGPRFSTKGTRVSMSRTSGTGNTTIELGRVEVDNPRNANNIIGVGYDDQISPRHRYQLRASDGTEFVAVIRKTRLVQGGYLFAPIRDGADSGGSSLVMGATYTKTWVNLDGKSESEIGILELVLRGRI